MSAEAKAPPLIVEPVVRRVNAGSTLLLAAMAGVLLVLFFNEPHGQKFYPLCPMYAQTGLACAGCGGMRAVHQLLHGNLASAFHYNPLLIVMLPVIGWFFARWVAREWFQRELWPQLIPNSWWWALGIGTVVFSVLRNLPWTPFHWLGP